MTLEAVTKSRFYEDPDPMFSPVEMFRMPAGKPGGEPFAALSGREKLQVLGYYTHWEDYQKRGLGFKDIDQGFNNAVDGKPREKWLEGTSFVEPPRMTETREKLIRESFELSREVGYAQFLAENFDRPDPALQRLGPEERKAFLRQWRAGARDRMYESYLERVATMSNDDLERNKKVYKAVMDAAITASTSTKIPAPPPPESPNQKAGIRGTLRAQLEANPKSSTGRKPKQSDRKPSH
jgi:hypothetical protein